MSVVVSMSDMQLIPALSCLSDAQKVDIGRHGVRTVYEAKKTVYQIGDRADFFYFVCDGTLAARSFSDTGRQVNFFQYYAGDQFGFSSAFSGDSRNTNVEAVSNVSLLAFPSEYLTEMMSKYPKLGEAMFRAELRKHRLIKERFFEFATLPVALRIRRELLRLAQRELLTSDRKQDSFVELDPAPSHHEIAASAGTHREAVTRELSLLASTGLIEKSRRSIRINDIKALLRLIGGAEKKQGCFG